MIKKLRMTDISAFEVERELGYIRYSQMISPKVYENDFEVVLECDVTEQNRVIFAKVFRALSEYVYSDDDADPFERLASLVSVRNIRLGILDQGFRGKLVEKLVSCGCKVKTSMYFDTVDDVYRQFASNDQKQIVESYAKAFGLDVVIFGTAEFEDEGIISSSTKAFVWSGGKVFEKSYLMLGKKDYLAEKLCCLATALADKKIY